MIRQGFVGARFIAPGDARPLVTVRSRLNRRVFRILIPSRRIGLDVLANPQQVGVIPHDVLVVPALPGEAGVHIFSNQTRACSLECPHHLAECEMSLRNGARVGRNELHPYEEDYAGIWFGMTTNASVSTPINRFVKEPCLLDDDAGLAQFGAAIDDCAEGTGAFVCADCDEVGSRARIVETLEPHRPPLMYLRVIPIHATDCTCARRLELLGQPPSPKTTPRLRPPRMGAIHCAQGRPVISSRVVACAPNLVGARFIAPEDAPQPDHDPCKVTGRPSALTVEVAACSASTSRPPATSPKTSITLSDPRSTRSQPCTA